MILFENQTHEGFSPLDLPPKSQGERPEAQFGFTAPDGGEWSVLVRRSPFVPVDTSLGSKVQLWLTLASRSDGKTIRIGDEPLVHPRHELVIDPADLTGEGGLQNALERATVHAWEQAQRAAKSAPTLINDLKAIGLIVSPTEAGSSADPDEVLVSAPVPSTLAEWENHDAAVTAPDVS